MESKKRYAGYICYSRKDNSFCKELHNFLENYKLPKNLVLDSVTSSKIGRFFRDQDELAAGNEIGFTLKGALRDSDTLIVICSSNSVKSYWVNEEVKFYKNYCNGSIIPIIKKTRDYIDKDKNTEYFPEALRAIDLNKQPLAIDFNKENKKKALIKVVASILNIDFDKLWQREKKRLLKNRRIKGSILLFLSLILGLIIALANIAPFRISMSNLNSTAGIIASIPSEHSVSSNGPHSENKKILNHNILMSKIWTSRISPFTISIDPPQVISAYYNAEFGETLSIQENEVVKLSRDSITIDIINKEFLDNDSYLGISEGLFSKDGKYIATVETYPYKKICVTEINWNKDSITVNPMIGDVNVSNRDNNCYLSDDFIGASFWSKKDTFFAYFGSYFLKWSKVEGWKRIETNFDDGDFGSGKFISFFEFEEQIGYSVIHDNSVIIFYSLSGTILQTHKIRQTPLNEHIKVWSDAYTMKVAIKTGRHMYIIDLTNKEGKETTIWGRPPGAIGQVEIDISKAPVDFLFGKNGEEFVYLTNANKIINSKREVIEINNVESLMHLQLDGALIVKNKNGEATSILLNKDLTIPTYSEFRKRHCECINKPVFTEKELKEHWILNLLPNSPCDWKAL